MKTILAAVLAVLVGCGGPHTPPTIQTGDLVATKDATNTDNIGLVLNVYSADNGTAYWYCRVLYFPQEMTFTEDKLTKVGHFDFDWSKFVKAEKKN